MRPDSSPTTNTSPSGPMARPVGDSGAGKRATSCSELSSSTSALRPRSTPTNPRDPGVPPPAGTARTTYGSGPRDVLDVLACAKSVLARLTFSNDRRDASGSELPAEGAIGDACGTPTTLGALGAHVVAMAKSKTNLKKRHMASLITGDERRRKLFAESFGCRLVFDIRGRRPGPDEHDVRNAAAHPAGRRVRVDTHAGRARIRGPAEAIDRPGITEHSVGKLALVNNSDDVAPAGRVEAGILEVAGQDDIRSNACRKGHVLRVVEGGGRIVTLGKPRTPSARPPGAGESSSATGVGVTTPPFIGPPRRREL